MRSISTLALLLCVSTCMLAACDDGGGTNDNPSDTAVTDTHSDVEPADTTTTSPGDTVTPDGGDVTTAQDSTDPGDTADQDTVAQDTTDAGDMPQLCGNGTCDAGELCDVCEVDCGVCEEPLVTECNDGIDNDGDGRTDWAWDTGCWGEGDDSEAATSRAEESGWTTFDPDENSQLIYVSSTDGDDANDGLTPQTAVATPQRGAELVRDGEYDFLLFKRGDTWRGDSLGDDRVRRRFKSGRDADHPIVIASYGESTERPRFELDTHFMDDDGNGRRNLAIIGLALVSYPRVPGDPDFDGAGGGALRFVSADSGDVLMEDLYLEYGEFVLQNGTDYEVRRNVVFKSYHVGTCAYNDDGSINPNGDNTYRPSGIFAGGVDGLTIEGNVWDHNGWNPDVEEACATIYNHDLYLSGCSRLTVRDNLIVRASSIGIKMAANSTGASDVIDISDNLFAEGEIGLGMGGNSSDPSRFLNATVAHNVFTDIGRAQPTGRTLTWYLGISDNVNTEIVGNLLINQPMLGNTSGIDIHGGTNSQIHIHDNLAYNMGRRVLEVSPQSGWSEVTIEDNTFSSDRDGNCLVQHEGAFDAVTYRNNAYDSAASESDWFCVDDTRTDLAGWTAASGETGASASVSSPPDPGRNLDGYAAHLGLGDTLVDFADAARGQSRHTWRPELTARAAANWIREGYGVAAR